MKVIVLGQVQGTNLGIKVLKVWTFTNLHESLHNFVQVGNCFFEITFLIKIDNKHALENSFNYEGINVMLLAWHLGFSSNKEKSLVLLHNPLWV